MLTHIDGMCKVSMLTHINRMCRLSMLSQFVRPALDGRMREAKIRSGMPVKIMSSMLQRRR